MRSNRPADLRTLAVLSALAVTSVALSAQEWTVWNASFTLELSHDAHEHVRLSAAPGERGALVSGEFLIVDEALISVSMTESGAGGPAGQTVSLADGLVLSTDAASVRVTELLVTPDSQDGSLRASDVHGPYLELRGVRASLDASDGTIVMPAMAVVLSPELARALGDPSLAGDSIGWGVLRGAAVWSGGEVPPAPAERSTAAAVSSSSAAPSGGTIAPDVTFCELYGLAQFGRAGDVVGLAINTTSWNRGNADLTWFAIPDSRHPFIVQNLYRIKEDRFEQIGQSWIKHGFFALGDEQCQSPCTFEDEEGHGVGPYLGMGCTDTYSAGLNALQSGLGPREEVNPWTGEWDFATSEMATSHSHNAIQHRLQVHDADLDPASNLAARYFAEGYYVHFEDVVPLNNAAWKEITSISGSPGGTWSFSMPGLGTDMKIGFAVNAWEGAAKTFLAEQFPVQKGVSPDGRCDLRAKATDNGDGTWHYEYAILNIDMERKASGFTVPLDAATVVSNVGFHAVESHDESFSNDPWTAEISGACPVGDRCLRWTTQTNPLRWGTVYNFRFDADAPPHPGLEGDPRGVQVTLDLFEPGAVESVSGLSIGPTVGSLLIPAAASLPAPDGVGSHFPKNRFLSIAVEDQGFATALRVKLTSLHHPDMPEDAPDFSAFESQFRFVNLYRDPETNEPLVDCPDSGGFGTSYKCAILGCEPEYAEWEPLLDGSPLHITGDAVVPSSIYEVDVLAFTCAGEESDCPSVSGRTVVTTSLWGSVDDDPVLTVLDVTGVVDRVKDLAGSFIEPRSLLRGDTPDPLGATPNVMDITLGLDALKGFAYPLAGPSACP